MNKEREEEIKVKTAICQETEEGEYEIRNTGKKGKDLRKKREAKTIGCTDKRGRKRKRRSKSVERDNRIDVRRIEKMKCQKKTEILEGEQRDTQR